jgi:hypothetical protein
MVNPGDYMPGLSGEYYRQMVPDVSIVFATSTRMEGEARGKNPTNVMYVQYSILRMRMRLLLDLIVQDDGERRCRLPSEAEDPCLSWCL